ncbi:MAG: protein-L-isoaspartate(D-aspartate) O-methyltransferase [Sphingobacteriales bacterium]|nr:MAG: protein-L-isoaspartate(D-aspartate) O-methyltransferase [Sphingobacteriales bacterium]
MQDTFRHQGLRKQLVRELKELGIKDEKVLAAIQNIPRHWFIEASFEDRAYENSPFPIGSGQTISNPYTVAYQTELLDVQKTDKVLEIGTGSAYQACVLALLCNEVHTIERHKPLVQDATTIIQDLILKNIFQYYGDGFEGIESQAPFDKIIITAAAPEIPKKLLEQLKIGGVLVLPLGKDETQQMLRIQRKDKITFEKEYFDYFTFVPMLKGVK